MKIYLDTIGCRLNQSEIEKYAWQFRAAGHTLIPDAGKADLAVVNTCSVTVAAASDSRKKIRQAARAGAENVIVTGCWATMAPKDAVALPGVGRVIPNCDKDNLVFDVLQIPVETFDLEPVAREPVPGARLRTRAFIKAQDGCDNRCTFCVTTLARGPGRSQTTAQVLDDVRAALRGGVQEVVLTGVHLGSWGRDLDPPLRLSDLIRAILDETAAPRLRISSLEPWNLEANFFNLWSDPRLCRQLHIPLQSGCAATLQRMARKTKPRAFAELVAAARAAIPDVAITTDVIVGFPGESEVEFRQSMDFVHQLDFAQGHVFTFSARPGTAAAAMPAQVPHAVRKTRHAEMQTVFAKSEAAYQTRFLGRSLPVLWESATALGPEGWTLVGLTDNYLRVTAQSQEHLWNQITPVKLTALTDQGLRGQIVSNE